MTAPLPLIVVTGFLGAGKTTLLNQLLRDPAFAASAVIVNEFGEVGLDHLLIEAVDGDRLVLTTGCICCAARGDLLAAVEGLMERRRAGALAFDRIVIETTGLADPGPILNALLLGPALAGDVRLAGVLTLVSAIDGDVVLDHHDEARRQVALADRLLVTKADLAIAATARLHDRLATLNPAAPIDDVRDVVDAAALLDMGAGSFDRAAEAGRGHRHHHAADARIRAVVLEAGTVDATRLGGFVTVAQERHGAALLRLKGVAALRHDPGRPAVVQAVGHLLHPVTRLRDWSGADPRTRLVAILDGVDPAAVESLWDAFFGPPAIDRPDAAALVGDDGPGLFG